MRVSKQTADILYVTERQPDSGAAADRVGLDDAVVSVVSELDRVANAVSELPADYLLVGADVDRTRAREILGTLKDEDPDIATVVFVDDGDRQFIEQVVAADSCEVVTGTVAATPPALLRRRLESAGAERKEQELIEQVRESRPVGILTIDPDGTITRANEQAASILGLPAADIVDSEQIPDAVELYSTDGEKLEPDSYPDRRVLKNDEQVVNERLVVEQPAGDRRTVSIDGERLIEDGEVSRAILTLEDVTASVQRETRLTEQRNRLARLDQLNRIIRGVDQALLEATNREEIMHAVCEQLVASTRYRFAVALRPLGNGNFGQDSWAGPAGSFVEAVFPTSSRSADDCPGIRAAETGEIQQIADLTAPTEFDAAAWHERALEAGVRSTVAVPVTYEGEVFGVITVYATIADAVTDRELDVLDELGETVGYAIAATERREREQILTSLYETTQDLLAAETESGVAETVVDVASSVLDAPGIGICLFDDETNTLETVAATEEMVEFYGGVTVFGPGEANSATWQAYATGETKFFPDVRESDHVVNPETDARSTLLIPLGEHGVFVVSAAEAGVFSDKRRRLIGLLAATTEAALDRVAGRADLRRRDRELADRARRVDTLEALLSTIRGVDRRLVTAGTREELESGVCEQLLGDESHAFAWIGTMRPAENRVEPTAWAGDGDGYLDVVSLEGAAGEPMVRAARTGDVVTVPDVTDQLRERPWARHAADWDIQSVAAVPLVHAGATYGVLGVYATEPEAFDGVARSVLTRIAETTAYGINTIETRRSVLGEQQTEVELAIDRPGTFLNAVARVAGEPVTYRKVTPTGDGRSRVVFSLGSAPAEDVLALEDEFVSVESLSAVEPEGESLFRASLSAQPVAATVLDCGGVPTTVVATGTETTAVVRLSRGADVRGFLDRFTGQFPGAELGSRRTVEESRATARGAFAEIDEELTERQREVLITAFESGFFESPRETTGEELAALLDLSQPTVTHHLREAQRRLFATLLAGSAV